MRITLLEPYCTGSHEAWAREYAAHSAHQVELLTLPGRNWKWRMHGGAVELAGRFLRAGCAPDLLLATDMLDLTTFLALTRGATAGCRCALYFHENQLTYPWSPTDPDRPEKRDLHYAFINYASALAADAVLFNSAYHRRSFLEALPLFLKAFPDCADLRSVEAIAAKSRVLALGLDLKRLDRARPQEAPRNGQPVVLWNHRWEYDKDPEAFFQALFTLADEGVPFQVVVLGESFGRCPQIFATAKEKLADRVLHWGYAEDFAAYAQWLWRADVVPVTSRQDFFGISVVEALYCGCAPLLPDRLAYPEHLSGDDARWCLYGEGEALVDRLRALLLQGARGEGTLREHVARYDWSVLAPQYDAFFAKLAAQGAAPPSPSATPPCWPGR